MPPADRTVSRCFSKRWMENNEFYLAVDSELFDGVDDVHNNIGEKYSLSISQIVEYTPNRIRKAEKEPRVRTGFSCKSRKGIIQISPDFSLSLCNRMRIRWNLRTTNLNTALEELQALIKKFENAPLNGCNGCTYANYCNMCFANAQLINGELFIPSGHCTQLEEKCKQYLAQQQ